MSNQDNVTIYNWDDIPLEELNDHISRKLVTGEKAMLAHIYLKKGGIVPLHSHPNEQLTFLTAGALKFWIGSLDAEPIVLNTGEVMVIPANLPHQAEALEDTVDIDIFSPPREDWINKTDDYLRKK